VVPEQGRDDSGNVVDIGVVDGAVDVVLDGNPFWFDPTATFWQDLGDPYSAINDTVSVVDSSGGLTINTGVSTNHVAIGDLGGPGAANLDGNVTVNGGWGASRTSPLMISRTTAPCSGTSKAEL
jgi:hypothetical protein